MHRKISAILQVLLEGKKKKMKSDAIQINYNKLTSLLAVFTPEFTDRNDLWNEFKLLRGAFVLEVLAAPASIHATEQTD